MKNLRYQAGDLVFLKAGAFQAGEPNQQCRILSVLPDAYGRAQYRIQFGAENWERRITHEDIDHHLSERRSESDGPDETPVGGSWVNSSSIKIKR